MANGPTGELVRCNRCDHMEWSTVCSPLALLVGHHMDKHGLHADRLAELEDT